MTLSVGDTGVVRDVGRRGADRPAVVVWVGRRWATIESTLIQGHALGRFDKETGYEDSGRYTPRSRFVTPEQAQHEAEIADAWEVIREAGFERRWAGRRASDRLVLAVAETIRGMRP